MKIIKNIVISEAAPDLEGVGWLLPLQDGTFKLKFFSSNGWVDASSGVQGPAGPKGDKGDKGDQGEAGPAGMDGKSIKAMSLAVDQTGEITGGTITLTDDSLIPVVVVKI